jgi:glycogen synthase
MKIAYVDRDGGALVSAMARCMAAGGHEVWAVGGEAGGDQMGNRIRHAPLLPPLEPNGWYFDQAHRYADQVYATVQALNAEVGLDVVDFPERHGQGFTTVRAKRLLGEFSRTTLVVRLDGSASAPPTLPHTDFRRAVRTHLERYGLTHADVVTSSSRCLAGEAGTTLGVAARHVGPGPLLRPPTTAAATGARPQPPRAVFIGPLDPLAGADAFVRIALEAVEADAGLSFHLYGEDVDCAPFRTSFAEHLRAQLRAAGAERIGISGPLAGADLVGILDQATFCLFPARRGPCPAALPLALDRGCVVVADAAGPAAELIEHRRSGLLADTGLPAAAAAELLACLAAPGTLLELSAGARRQAAHHCRDEAVRARLEAAYGAPRRASSRNRRPDPASSRISVVIPLYNQGRYLREAVGSAHASTHADTEVVVVDDGSTDPHTTRVFDELHGVVKVRKANGGIASALNAGLAASSGHYIVPLGADDLLHPEYLAKGLAALQRNPDLSYVTCYARYFELLDLVYAPVGYVPELMLFLHTDGKTTTMFDAKALRDVGGYDEDMFAFEDWEIQIRLHKRGHRGDVLPAALFSYRRHAESTVYTRSNFNRIELLQFIADKHQDLLAELYPVVVAHLLHLWKTGYEPSESVRQQLAAGAFGDREPA